MEAVSLEAKETIPLGDFHIDLLTQNTPWINLANVHHVHQVITKPTGITVSSNSLIDHIVSDVNSIIEHCVPASGSFDHYPVCLTLPRRWTKIPTAGQKLTYKT